MVEQTHAGEAHSNAVLVAAFDYVVITNGSAGFCDVGNAGSARTFDVVAEGEECVGSQSHAGDAVKVSLLFFLGQFFRTGGEVILPYIVAQNVFALIGDVNIDDIVTVGSAESGQEGESQYLGMTAEVPDVSLVAGQSGAVDSGLLTCAYTDRLTVNGEAYGIGLGVLEGDEGNDQVENGLFGDVLGFGYTIFENASVLKADILTGRYPISFRLPTEKQLAQQEGVSFITIRSSLKMLEDDGEAEADEAADAEEEASPAEEAAGDAADAADYSAEEGGEE